MTTLLAIAAACVACVTLGHWRTVAVVGIWIIYIPIFTVGMASIRMRFFCPAVCRGSAGKMQVALTFDDGPDPASTPALLDLLQRENIKATFFCIGRNVAAHPQLAGRIVREGHLIANHTYSHPWWIGFMMGPGLEREMVRTQQAIQDATGIMPTYMRPPMGITNPHYPRALRKVGLTPVGWDVRTFDTAGSVQTAVDRIVRRARDGSIILLHDGGVSAERLVEIVSAAISELRLRGLAFEGLDRLIEPGVPAPREKIST
jgi:peptidoglycan/xylan/chitin deacetylase (PgdA/CDA1 family)